MAKGLQDGATEQLSVFRTQALQEIWNPNSKFNRVSGTSAGQVLISSNIQKIVKKQQTEHL